MGWATTSALGGWPLVVRRRWTIPPSPSTHVLRSGLSRSQEVVSTGLIEAATIRGRHLPFHRCPATPTPRDERTELMSFHRSAKAPHAPPYPARRTFGLDRSLSMDRSRLTDVQDKESCGHGGVCLLTGQVGELAATATQSGEGDSQPHFTLFQSYSYNTSPLSAAPKEGTLSTRSSRLCAQRSVPAGVLGEEPTRSGRRIAILTPTSLGRHRQWQVCGKNQRHPREPRGRPSKFYRIPRRGRGRARTMIPRSSQSKCTWGSLGF